MYSTAPGTFDAAKIFKDWSEPPEIAGPTHRAEAVSMLRQHPPCDHDGARDCARGERRRRPPSRRSKSLPHGRRLKHTDNPRPVSALEGKFSVQYVVARALTDNAVTLRHFEEAAIAEPAIGRLLDVTVARAHPDMADDSTQQWGAEVIVTTTAGRRISRRVDNLVGRDAANPMSQQELWVAN